MAEHNVAGSTILGFFKSLVSYKRLLESSMWRDKIGELSSESSEEPGLKQFVEISKSNVFRLSAKLGALSDQEKRFIAEYVKANPTLVHYTNSTTKILKSKRLLSHKGLGYVNKDQFDSHSYGDTNFLCNDDFTFFRYEINHDSTKYSRFGKEALIITGEDSQLFNFGWVSLYEMLHPDTASVFKELKINDKTLRTGRILKDDDKLDTNSSVDASESETDSSLDGSEFDTDSSLDGSEGDINSSTIEYIYPQSGKVLKVDLREYVFFGSDIRLGLGLSIIEQLRLIGQDFQVKSLSNLTLENFTSLTKNLFRAEAKLPRSLNLASSKFEIETNQGYEMMLVECAKEKPSVKNLTDILNKYNVNTLHLTDLHYSPSGPIKCYLDIIIESMGKCTATKGEFTDFIKSLKLKVDLDFFNPDMVYNLFVIYAGFCENRQDALKEFISIFTYCKPKDSFAFVLVSSIENGESDDFIKSILENDINIGLCETDEQYPKPILILAVEKSMPTIVEALIEKGFDVNYNLCNKMPLVKAIEKNDITMAKLLLKHDAIPEIRGAYGGISAIEAVQKSTNTEIKELFQAKRSCLSV